MGFSSNTISVTPGCFHREEIKVIKPTLAKSRTCTQTYCIYTCSDELSVEHSKIVTSNLRVKFWFRSETESWSEVVDLQQWLQKGTFRGCITHATGYFNFCCLSRNFDPTHSEHSELQLDQHSKPESSRWLIKDAKNLNHWRAEKGWFTRNLALLTRSNEKEKGSETVKLNLKEISKALHVVVELGS